MAKRIICLIFCVLLVFCISACGESKDLYQEMTIIHLSEPEKCKTTENINTINMVLSVFSEMAKKDVDETTDEEWLIKVELYVDGNSFTYALNDDVFLDSNEKQYKVDGSAALKKIYDIYADLQSEEYDY